MLHASHLTASLLFSPTGATPPRCEVDKHDDAAAAMEVVLQPAARCYNHSREMLHPMARDATTIKLFCWNQPPELSLNFCLLEPAFLFAGTGVFICWNRLIVLFQQTMELLFAENFLLEPALIFPGTG